MAITFRGTEFAPLDMSRLTPGEVEAIEKVTGLSFARIRRLGEQCVCDHGRKAHEHKAADGSADEADRSCVECSCEQHESDLPMSVNTALMWVAIRRAAPKTTYREVADTPFDEFGGTAEAPPDPTRPSPATTSATP